MKKEFVVIGREVYVKVGEESFFLGYASSDVDGWIEGQMALINRYAKLTGTAVLVILRTYPSCPS